MNQPTLNRKAVYYLTGMRGSLSEGLGQSLADRGLVVTGRELRGDFRRLRFQEQVDAVADDLRHHHWSSDGRVIANSFGAYLFLHAQAQLPPYVGRVLLLSPIVGAFSNDEAVMGFIPPRAGKLHELAEAGSFPGPTSCEIHVGTEDWQSRPQDVQRLAKSLGLRVNLVEGAGHALPREYVQAVLDQWLNQGHQAMC